MWYRLTNEFVYNLLDWQAIACSVKLRKILWGTVSKFGVCISLNIKAKLNLSMIGNLKILAQKMGLCGQYKEGWFFKTTDHNITSWFLGFFWVFFGLPAKSYIFKIFSYTLIVFDNKQLALVLTKSSTVSKNSFKTSIQVK